MRHAITLLTLAALGGVVVSSCSLLQQATTGGGGSLEPIAIPTSAVRSDADEIVFAELHDDGSCLFVFTIEGTHQGPSILPIWPIGFNAKIGPRARLLYSAPDQEIALVAGAERMELHGGYVESAPADTVIPAGCVGYRLFLVREVFNRS